MKSETEIELETLVASMNEEELAIMLRRTRKHCAWLVRELKRRKAQAGGPPFWLPPAGRWN